MKLINSSYEILPYESDYQKAIEIAGRTAYQSQDKITKDSASKFVRMLETNKHGAALEHGTIYLLIRVGSPMYDLDYLENKNAVLFYEKNPYSVVNKRVDEISSVYYITTNYRVIFENNRQYDLKFKCELTDFHEKRISVRLIVSRAIQNELVRHRSMSFLIESTRFCNYSKDKFNNQLTFIIPNWAESISSGDYSFSRVYEGPDKWDMLQEGEYCFEWLLNGRVFYLDSDDPEQIFLSALKDSEKVYLELLNMKLKPQSARDILPLCLKTEMIMTGTVKDWKQVFKLRTAENAHPDVRKLMIELSKEPIFKSPYE